MLVLSLMKQNLEGLPGLRFTANISTLTLDLMTGIQRAKVQGFGLPSFCGGFACALQFPVLRSPTQKSYFWSSSVVGAFNYDKCLLDAFGKSFPKFSWQLCWIQWIFLVLSDLCSKVALLLVFAVGLVTTSFQILGCFSNSWVQRVKLLVKTD